VSECVCACVRVCVCVCVCVRMGVWVYGCGWVGDQFDGVMRGDQQPRGTISRAFERGKIGTQSHQTTRGFRSHDPLGGPRHDCYC
jgi:hypothetical protein